MLCSKVVPIVNGFADEYQGKMNFEVVDAKSDASQGRIGKYGLDIHGMVITDKQDKVLWKESGHLQKGPTVKAAIDKALKGE